jgi:hypothetical protein
MGGRNRLLACRLSNLSGLSSKSPKQASGKGTSEDWSDVTIVQPRITEA